MTEPGLIADYVAVGVDYCTVHHGIRNEDEERCDFARDDQEPISDPDSDDFGEPRPCALHALYYDGNPDA